MSSRAGRIVLIAAILAVSPCAAAYGGNTYINDIANVEVSEPNCTSFDINVSQASGGSATLTLRVYDVDEESGELDEVRLNGVLLGFLSGTDNTWSTTTFDVTNVVQYGTANTVQICIDPGGGESTTWVAEIDWGQILVDGGSAEDAEIVSLSADGEWDAIVVTTMITASKADTFRLEINLLDGGENKDIATDTFTLSAGATVPRANTVALPDEPPAGDSFTIEANLFNDTTGVQQSVETTTWQSASFPPTDIQISDDHVDEMLPAGAIVGVLSATDVDSTSHAFALVGGDVSAFAVDDDELLTATALDYETLDTYNLLIQAEDSEQNTYSKWVTLFVDNVNEIPVAVDDEATVQEGGSVLVLVTSNDTDPDGDPLEAFVATLPSHGIAIAAGGGIRYTPQEQYAGPDAFGYSVRDPSGATAQASVAITVQHVNHPPTADAGRSIHGYVGEPIRLNAGFSSDPDVGDTLQYRWDLNEDGVYDTDWLSTPLYTATYDEPFLGIVTLEVRDLMQGQPTGERSVDTTIARIDSVQSLVVFAYEDVDGDGAPSSTEPGIPDVEVVIGEAVVVTDVTGYAAMDLDSGTWDVSLTADALAALESRAFSVPVPAVEVLVGNGDRATVAFACIKTSTRLKGIVYVDENASGGYDEADRPVSDVVVLLDGDEENPRRTDETGAFTFLTVPFGAHSVLISTIPETDDAARLSLLVPVVLERTGKNELLIAWPYDLGPSEGFLQIDVEKEQRSGG